MWIILIGLDLKFIIVEIYFIYFNSILSASTLHNAKTMHTTGNVSHLLIVSPSSAI